MSKTMPVRSDRCGLGELFLAYETGDAERARLALGPGWTRRWTATWQVLGGDEGALVRDLGPVRRPSREAGQGGRRDVVGRCGGGGAGGGVAVLGGGGLAAARADGD